MFHPITPLNVLLSINLGLFLQYSLWSKPVDKDTSQNLSYAYSTDLRINYERIGHGYNKVVYLRGTEASMNTWDELKGLFPKNEFTLFVLDLKEFGKSSKEGEGNINLQKQTKIVVQFIKDIDADTLYLIGHSSGGAIALLTQISLLNEKGKSRISKLILIDCKENIGYSLITAVIHIDQTEYNKIINGSGCVPREEKPQITFEKIYSFIGRH